MSELWRKSALELAAMVRGREVSSREVVQAHLDRVEAVNPHVNAIVRLLPDQALAAADDADREDVNAEVGEVVGGVSAAAGHDRALAMFEDEDGGFAGDA